MIWCSVVIAYGIVLTLVEYTLFFYVFVIFLTDMRVVMILKTTELAAAICLEPSEYILSTSLIYSV